MGRSIKIELYLLYITRAFTWISFLVSVILAVEIFLGKTLWLIGARQAEKAQVLRQIQNFIKETLLKPMQREHLVGVCEMVGIHRLYQLVRLKCWYGNVPKIIFDIRGREVNDMIHKIDFVACIYPYRDTYTVCPGPNSNTFMAFVARQISLLKLDIKFH